MARLVPPDRGPQSNNKENQGDYNSLKNAANHRGKQVGPVCAEMERPNEAAKEGDFASQGDASPLPGTFAEIYARAKWAWN